MRFADRVERGFEQLLLRLCTSKQVDGLWVGAVEDAALARIEGALQLVKTYDPSRYGRLLRDLDRVWVRPLSGASGQFIAALRACVLDSRFVLDDTTTPEMIAATIVHEATHARLWYLGVGYDEGIRHRVEAICLRREVAFAAKLPDGEDLRNAAQDYLLTPPEYWTDAAWRERTHRANLEGMRDLGVPNWVVRSILAIASALRYLRRQAVQRPPV